MMREEFEALAGYEVSVQDYLKIIEPMYMATGLSKEEFVKCIDKKRFALPTKAELKRKMRKIAAHLYDICGLHTDYEAEAELERLAHVYMERVYGINWSVDTKAYCYFLRGYEYPNMRGCSYPETLVLGYNGLREFERIILVA